MRTRQLKPNSDRNKCFVRSITGRLSVGELAFEELASRKMTQTQIEWVSVHCLRLYEQSLFVRNLLRSYSFYFLGAILYVHKRPDRKQRNGHEIISEIPVQVHEDR